jgi:hypothetical protein
MYEEESFLQENAKEITEIIEATREDPENEEIRAEIAATLSDSLHRKKMRVRIGIAERGRGLDADLPAQRANERTVESMTGDPL